MAVVKSFEISFDLLWKYLKQLLVVRHGIEVASPKKVFKEAGLQDMLTEHELETFLTITLSLSRHYFVYWSSRRENVLLMPSSSR